MYIPKPDIEQLKQPEVAAHFQLILQNRFTGLESETDSENIYNTICNGVKDVSKETLPRNTETIPEWMSQQTKLAIANKHKIRKEKGSASMQYKIDKAESKKLVKKDNLNHIECSIEELNNLPPHKMYHAALKKA